MEAFLEKNRPVFNCFENKIEVKGQQKIFKNVCQKFELPEPQPEFQFDENRKWRIDYYFENQKNGVKLALEVEGGVWGFGRHNRPAGFLKDMEKYNALALAGILLLRVTPNKLVTLDTLTMIRKGLKIGEQATKLEKE